MAGLLKTFYRRQLPDGLTSLHSRAGRLLLKESLACGYAESFLHLSGNLAHQSEPAFCALSSLTMVLNALEIDPQRQWKGVWRWYEETLLECTPPLPEIRQNGMTFADFVNLSRCNGLAVKAKYGDEVKLGEFLTDVQSVTNGGNAHMVVSFSRKVLNQSGDGHFSPIGAFHAPTAQILVLDTARFKYPSYFVKAELLFEALKPKDPLTGLSRGYAILQKGDAGGRSIPLCRLLPGGSKLLSTISEDLLQLETRNSVHNSLKFILNALPMLSFREPGVDLTAEHIHELRDDLAKDIESLISELASSTLYASIREIVSLNRHQAALATLFFLSMPQKIVDALEGEARSFLEKQRKASMSLILASEVNRLAKQMEIIDSGRCESCGKRTLFDATNKNF